MVVSSLFSEHERRKSVKGTVRVKRDKKGEAISDEAHFLHPPIRNYNFRISSPKMISWKILATRVLS